MPVATRTSHSWRECFVSKKAQLYFQWTIQVQKDQEDDDEEEQKKQGKSEDDDDVNEADGHRVERHARHRKVKTQTLSTASKMRV